MEKEAAIYKNMYVTSKEYNLRLFRFVKAQDAYENARNQETMRHTSKFLNFLEEHDDLEEHFGQPKIEQRIYNDERL